MYPQFQSMNAAKASFKRCRKPQWFILVKSNENPDCACCGKPIADFSGIGEDGQEIHPIGYRNNRCVFNPRTKRVTAMHYVCMWTRALQKIADRQFA